MGGVDVGGGSGRSVNSDINMVPFIDLLMVTIAFLLVTAVWVTYSRINSNAQIPGPNTGPVPPEVAKVLHLHAQDNEFVLAWKQAATTVSETRLPRTPVTAGGAVEYPDLATQITKEWALHGGHQDPSDRNVDRCVFHADNAMVFREMVAVMDAVYEAKRAMVTPSGGEEKVSAFNLAFAVR